MWSLHPPIKGWMNLYSRGWVLKKASCWGIRILRVLRDQDTLGTPPKIWKWWFGWWLSSSRGVFSGSMLIVCCLTSRPSHRPHPQLVSSHRWTCRGCAAVKLSLGTEDSDGAKLRVVTAINIDKPYTSHIISIYVYIQLYTQFQFLDPFWMFLKGKLVKRMSNSQKGQFFRGCCCEQTCLLLMLIGRDVGVLWVHGGSY